MMLDGEGLPELPVPEGIDVFRADVYDRRSEIDPLCGEDWYTIALGWAIGRGMAPMEARDFATFVRFRTDMG